MTFSIKTVLLSFLVVGAFLAGWILPSPIVSETLTPVLIANRDIQPFSPIEQKDYRTVLLDKKLVSDFAARSDSQVEGCLTNYPIRQGGFIYLDDIQTAPVLVTPIVPPGKKAVALKLSKDFDPFAWYLLSKSDIVSIQTIDLEVGLASRSCIIPSCTVCTKPNSDNPSIVAVWLTPNESELLFDAQREGLQISIDRPK